MLGAVLHLHRGVALWNAANGPVLRNAHADIVMQRSSGSLFPVSNHNSAFSTFSTGTYGLRHGSYGTRWKSDGSYSLADRRAPARMGSSRLLIFYVASTADAPAAIPTAGGSAMSEGLLSQPHQSVLYQRWVRRRSGGILSLRLCRTDAIVILCSSL
jgi:hypothetical protein